MCTWVYLYVCHVCLMCLLKFTMYIWIQACVCIYIYSVCTVMWPLQEIKIGSWIKAWRGRTDRDGDSFSKSKNTELTGEFLSCKISFISANIRWQSWQESVVGSGSGVLNWKIITSHYKEWDLFLIILLLCRDYSPQK